MAYGADQKKLNGPAWAENKLTEKAENKVAAAQPKMEISMLNMNIKTNTRVVDRT